MMMKLRIVCDGYYKFAVYPLTTRVVGPLLYCHVKKLYIRKSQTLRQGSVVLSSGNLAVDSVVASSRPTRLHISSIPLRRVVS